MCGSVFPHGRHAENSAFTSVLPGKCEPFDYAGPLSARHGFPSTVHARRHGPSPQAMFTFRIPLGLPRDKFRPPML